MFNIFGLAGVGDGGWPGRLLPSGAPYFNMWLLNIAQAVIAVFLSADFLGRDKKLDTTEAFYVRSMSNPGIYDMVRQVPHPVLILRARPPENWGEGKNIAAARKEKRNHLHWRGVNSSSSLLLTQFHPPKTRERSQRNLSIGKLSSYSWTKSFLELANEQARIIWVLCQYRLVSDAPNVGLYWVKIIFVFFFSVPSSFRDKANPNFTIKRMYDSARVEFEQLERLREVCCVAKCPVVIYFSLWCPSFLPPPPRLRCLGWKPKNSLVLTKQYWNPRDL